jgi:hypothetical protein
MIESNGGTSLSELTCPICRSGTPLTGLKEASKNEGELIKNAFARFAIEWGMKPKLKELKQCYMIFVSNGVKLPSAAPPRCLSQYRHAVAQLEQIACGNSGTKILGQLRR